MHKVYVDQLNYFIERHSLLTHACLSVGFKQDLQHPQLSDLQPAQVPQRRFLFFSCYRHSNHIIHTVGTIPTTMIGYEIYIKQQNLQ